MSAPADNSRSVAPNEREAHLRARENAVTERIGELRARARLLARLESRVAAREEAVAEREARVESANARLSADAVALDRDLAKLTGSQTVILDPLVAEDEGAPRATHGGWDRARAASGSELRDSTWWSQVTGRSTQPAGV
jgi:hypothetical protein